MKIIEFAKVISRDDDFELWVNDEYINKFSYWRPMPEEYNDAVVESISAYDNYDNTVFCIAATLN